MPRATLFLPLLLFALSSDAAGSNWGDETDSATAGSARIAFVRGTRQLVVADSDGRNQRTVARLRPGFRIFDFSWEPTGRRLAFEATTPLGKERLYVVGANGRGLRRLAQWEDYASAIAWSPRGRKILFDKHDDGDHQLWTINADGSGARKLTPVVWFTGPTWSPDGRKISFFGRPGRRRVTGIYVMRADGRQLRLIIRVDLEGGRVVWSPANKIAFYLGDDLWIVNPDGSGRRIAIRDDPEWYEPGGIAFSRDGRRVAFSAVFSPGNGEVMIGDVSTGNVQRLTNNDMLDSPPSWSPDGRSLVFARYRRSGDGPGEIYVLNADGSGERNLTNSPADEHSPVWAPR